MVQIEKSQEDKIIQICSPIVTPFGPGQSVTVGKRHYSHAHLLLERPFGDLLILSLQPECHYRSGHYRRAHLYCQWCLFVVPLVQDGCYSKSRYFPWSLFVSIYTAICHYGCAWHIILSRRATHTALLQISCNLLTPIFNISLCICMSPNVNFNSCLATRNDMARYGNTENVS